MGRAEHIKCIAHTHADKIGVAWCGRRLVHEWAFVDIDHAVYTVEQKQRLVPCQACVAAICQILSNSES